MGAQGLGREPDSEGFPHGRVKGYSCETLDGNNSVEGSSVGSQAPEHGEEAGEVQALLDSHQWGGEARFLKDPCRKSRYWGAFLNIK